MDAKLPRQYSISSERFGVGMCPFQGFSGCKGCFQRPTFLVSEFPNKQSKKRKAELFKVFRLIMF